jgi:tRNA acetyltransferase TAN1
MVKCTLKKAIISEEGLNIKPEEINPTEQFNLLVTFKADENFEEVTELGIEEIVKVLEKDDFSFYVKESEFPGVVMVELKEDPVYAALKLKQASTRTISQVMLINEVVRTSVKLILEEVLELAESRMAEGDSFSLKSGLVEERYVEPKKELFEIVTQGLTQKLDFKCDDLNPDWVVRIEMMSENTGVSVLKYKQFKMGLTDLNEFKEDFRDVGTIEMEGMNKL